jgi:hypothetical protein
LISIFCYQRENSRRKDEERNAICQGLKTQRGAGVRRRERGKSGKQRGSVLGQKRKKEKEEEDEEEADRRGKFQPAMPNRKRKLGKFKAFTLFSILIFMNF